MNVFCRFCKANLKTEPILTLNNMPKSAQFFPKKDELDAEKGVDIVLYQCPYCGLVQAAGEPVSYFRDVIRATGVSDEMGNFRRKQYAEFVKKYNLADKKIIEIGAGSGEYMNYMEPSCKYVYGLEHLEVSVKKAEAAGHKMIKGFIEEESYVIDGGPYDGFYIMNYLEHIPDPSGFVRGIYNNLSDGAVGIVEVPNFDMMLREDLYSEFIQDHLSYFRSDTLKVLLENSGFDVIDIKPIWHDYILSAVVRKKALLDLSSMKKQKDKLFQEIQQFLINCKNNGLKVAIWGAGHQALANMSLLGMADYVDYVLDSADFKQGYYTPATHIKIIAPSAMVSKGINMVIIMAGSYSVEISRIMDKDYPNVQWRILGSDGLYGEE